MKNKIINGLVLVSPVVVGLFYLIKGFGLNSSCYTSIISHSMVFVNCFKI
jgi:hypothetical protein